MHTTIPQSYADNLQFVYLKVCVVWTNRQQLKNCHQIDPFRMDDNRGAFQVLRSNKCATFFNYDWCMPSNYLFCLRNHNSAFSALRFCMKFHYNEAFSSSLVFYHFWPKIVLSTGIKITPILTAYLKQRNHNIAHIYHYYRYHLSHSVHFRFWTNVAMLLASIRVGYCGPLPMNWLCLLYLEEDAFFVLNSDDYLLFSSNLPHEYIRTYTGSMDKIENP